MSIVDRMLQAIQMGRLRSATLHCFVLSQIDAIELKQRAAEWPTLVGLGIGQESRNFHGVPFSVHASGIGSHSYAVVTRPHDEHPEIYAL